MESFDNKHEPSKYKKLFPYLMLAVLISVTFYFWRIWSDSETEKEQRRYAENTDSIIQSIAERLHDCMMILQGSAGIFAASENVTRDEWRTYSESRQVSALFPGIQGIGFSRVVQPSELARHIQGIRAEGYPDYAVWPAGERDVYTAIIYLEPFDARNRRALGYDMFSEPVPRAAMERARDTGAISISGKVKPGREFGTDVQARFLMYAPVYAAGMPHNTPEERRAAITGYVYSPFRMNDLIQGILPDAIREIGLKIYDGAAVSTASLLYDSDASSGAPDKKREPMFSSRKTIDFSGRQWTLAFETKHPFEAAVNRNSPKWVLAIGVVINLLVFFLLRAQENTRERALTQANEMASVLQENEYRFKKLFDTAPDCLIIVDSQGKIVQTNAQTEVFFGYSRDELTGMTIHKLVPSRYSRHAALHQEYMQNPYTRPMGPGLELFARGKDGSEFPVEIILNPVETTQGDQAMVTVRDITGRKRLEKELIAREAAEQANRTKNEFLATMSHELRTPLNAVIGFSEVLIEGVAGELADRQKDYVNDILESGQHLLSLINDILDLSKVEAGKMELEPREFDLHQLLKGSLNMVKEKALKQGIRLELEISSAPETIVADERKIKQIVFNLLSNAVKFTLSGGIVRIEAGSEDNSAVVCVRDTGIGISSADIERVFKPFEQADSALNRKYQGTGLGLPLVKSFVELHGGKVWVESEIDKGSGFYFSIPLRPPEANSNEREVPLP